MKRNNKVRNRNKIVIKYSNQSDAAQQTLDVFDILTNVNTLLRLIYPCATVGGLNRKCEVYDKVVFG